MGLREVRSELQKLSQKELIQHCAELYKKYKPVKEYFDFYANPDESKLLESYQEKIDKALAPAEPHRVKPAAARKAINDFKKLGTSPQSLAELLIFWVKKAVIFADVYDFPSTSFFNSISRVYEEALVLLSKNELLQANQKLAYEIVNASEGASWGLDAELQELYRRFYEPH